MYKYLNGKKTKIIATIGPASANPAMMEKMMKAGMDLVRLNFSHGTHDDHGEVIKNVRASAQRIGKRVAILQDLSGPKIRLTELEGEPFEIKRGQKIIITTKPQPTTPKVLSVNYQKLHKEVKNGGIILIDDGTKRLRVNRVRGYDIQCTVEVGGMIKSRKGVNVPGANLSIKTLTLKDRKDVLFGIQNGVDYIALSFVRNKGDIISLRNLIKKHGAQVSIIAKIETPEAVENIDDIIEVADGIMVARGDLAVEIGPSHVPFVQKMIISKSRSAGKPVIVATQMLQSMEEEPVPTRAEVSDVANAVLDGGDAVMLSGESATGKYPLQTIQTMAQIIESTETQLCQQIPRLVVDSIDEVVHTVTDHAVQIADHIGAVTIVALTESGYTARMMARFRSQYPLVVLSPSEKVCQELILVSGCIPLLINLEGSVRDIEKGVFQILKKYKFAKKGDKIVMTSGMPFGKSGTTNAIHALIVE